jgi:NAD+ kinase
MGLIGTVGLVVHPLRRCAPAVETINSWAAARGVTVLGLSGEVDTMGCPVEPVEADALAERTDVMISLGGDGTMLRALRLGYPRRVPVLGVNLGRLGFLAEVDVPELPEAVQAIDENRFTVESRSGVVSTMDGEETVSFNDIVLARIPGNRGMTAIQVYVEGHPFVRYSADAVVVATPTGSTAYSFSAGGPIVSPRAEGMLVVPVAPHSAFNRALFLSSGEKLRLDVLPSSGELAIEADGRIIRHAYPGTVVDIAMLPDAARVIRLGRTTFYQRAQRRLRLPSPLETD